MIPDFDQHGNLPDGIYNSNIREFKDKFVNSTKFEGSTKRKPIFEKYKEYNKMLCDIGIGELQWVNGSYTTTKLNPNDIDLVSHINGDEFYNNQEKQEKISYLNNQHDRIHIDYLCDTYYILKYPEADPRYPSYKDWYDYWKDTFGHEYDKVRHVQVRPKGIVEFNIDGEQFKISLNAE